MVFAYLYVAIIKNPMYILHMFLASFWFPGSVIPLIFSPSAQLSPYSGRYKKTKKKKNG